MKTSWRDVLRDCLALAKPIGTEHVARHESHLRVLAEDVRADRDYPAGNLSMMDGYAFDDRRREAYVVEGENAPGSGAGEVLAAGTTRRIFTGAELPPGATCVVPQELIRREGDKLQVNEWPGTNFVRARGCEALAGDKVLAAGTRLGPVEVAMLATVGCSRPLVFTRPRVARIGTGDEVVSPDSPLPVGKIRDSNADLIESLLREINLPVQVNERVSDDRDRVFELVRRLADSSDVLLISGGASVGDHDHARPALEAAGLAFLAHGLHVRPGRPVGIARRGDQWAVALPGNPLSHLVIMRLLISPILRACSGEAQVEPQLLRGVLAGDIHDEAPRRDTFWPARISVQNGVLHATPGRFLSSGDLLGTASVNGFINLPVGKTVPAPGEAIDILPLTPHFP